MKGTYLLAVQLAGVSVSTLAVGPEMVAFQTEVSCCGVVRVPLQVVIVLVPVLVMFR
jgi:hypothetical protein